MSLLKHKARFWWNSQPAAVRSLLTIITTGYLLMLLVFIVDKETSYYLSSLFVLDSNHLSWLFPLQLISHTLLRPVSDFFGVIVDLMILGSLGGYFGRRWRQSHFLFFYSVSTLAGALFAVGLGLALPDWFGVPLYGCRAGSMALLTAFWLFLGEQKVSVFRSSPLPGKWFFFAIAGLQVLLFAAGRNPQICLDLGGFLAGWLLVTGRWRPSRLSAWIRTLHRRFRLSRSRFTVVR